MKTRLLYFVLLLSSYLYAQYPTTNLTAAYELNGNLIDQANGVNLTLGNGFMLYPADRFSNSGSSASLIFGDASRPDIDFVNGSPFSSGKVDFVSYNFWINTSINDSNRRSIIEDSDRTDDNDTDFDGYFIYLKDGKIGTRASMRSSINYHNRSNEHPKTVSDGEWHNINVELSHDKDFLNDRTYISIIITIDGDEDNGYYSIVLDPALITTTYDTNGTIVIGNNRAGNMPIANRYTTGIDNLLIYSQPISQAEIQSIIDFGNYCAKPDNSIVSVTPITNDGGTININDSGTYDVAYVLEGDAFSNATIVNNVTSSYAITGLESNLNYEVYIREICAVTTSWSDSITFKTNRPTGTVYVNPTATGLNTGTSWANAFTNLQTALDDARLNESIWIAGGTYKPEQPNGDRTTEFTISTLVKVYGGFNGTENAINERLDGANPTVLSGDLNGNDDTNINPSNTLRSDNSYHVLVTNVTTNSVGVGVVLDRLTITGGNANGTGTNNRGGALIKGTATRAFTMVDCIIENNSGTFRTVDTRVGNGGLGEINVDRCIFRNNYSRGGALYCLSDTTTTVNVSNSLFSNNTAADVSGSGEAGSSIRLKSSVSSNIILDVRNSTFVNNQDLGTTTGYNNFNRATIILERSISNGGTPSGTSADIYNSIFYNNTTVSGLVAKSISGGSSTLPGVDVYNSIDQDGFSQLDPARLTNVINTNPLFVDAPNDDYTISMNSPAVDSANSNFVNTTLDLAKNQRDVNGVSDIGAYEYIGSCGDFFKLELIPDSVVSSQATLNWEHPSAATGYDIIYVESGQLMASGTLVNIPSGNTKSLVITGLVPDTFYDVYIRAYCNGTPSTYKLYTLGFKTVIYVNDDAAGNNSGLDWNNAFTSLETALASSYNESVIWIADGTYRPTGNARNSTFLVTKNDIKIYGGFNGTETNINQRDLTLNESIISGDLNGDDTGVSFTGNGRSENVYHIITINGNRLLIDGVVIEGGQADASAGDNRFGAGIFWLDQATNGQCTMNNTTFKNNIAVGGAGVFFRHDRALGGTIDLNFLNVQGCTFSNNIATYAAGIYTTNTNISPFVTVGYTITVANSLFYENTTMDRGTDLGFTGSSIWTRANSTASKANSNFFNNTFVDNLDIGTRASTERGTLSVSRNSQFQTRHTAKISNNIFYNNRGTSNAVTKAVTRGHTTIAENLSIKNSIDEDDFSNIASGSKVNTSNANPLFTDASNNDYSLTNSSPAIDTGENTDVVGTLDLLGNQRLFNGIVDMGAYEYFTSLIISPKVLLQGAMLNASSQLMNDDLRLANYIPTTSPYADAATCNSSVFSVTGNNAIVDWVLVELRDATTNTTVVASQSGLIQRDGDIVAVDGTSSLVLNVPNGNYYTVVKHRNHLGIMTLNTIALGQSATVIDFTNASTPITFGTDAQTTFGMPSGLLGMWAGDTNGDGRLNYLGAQSDIPSIRSQVFTDPANSLFGGPPIGTYGSLGYYSTDINMDGKTYYSGAASDVLFIRDNIFNNPSNSLFGGPPIGTYVFVQQLPEGANN